MLADRGFSIAEDVGFFAAKVVIPAKTRGKMQLTPFEIEETRRLAHLRIHVERVIGMNNWKFLLCDTHLSNFFSRSNQ